jgi:hypothetical protein
MLYRPLAQTTALFVSWRGAADGEDPSVSQYVTELQRGTNGGAVGLRVGGSEGIPDGELEGAKEGVLDGAKEGVLDGCLVGGLEGGVGGSVQSARQVASV